MYRRGRNAVASILILSAAVASLCLPAAPARAGANNLWVGTNGVVRFSFVEGDSLVSVFQTGDPQHDMTQVNLYAWLTDIDQVSLEKVAFLRIGALEMTLQIEGGEPQVFKPTLSGQHLNIGRSPEEIVAALNPGLKTTHGEALLAHWVLLFKGERPENVRFSLTPVTSKTCTGAKGCSEADPRLVFVSTKDSDINQYVFGAPCEPAWLNPQGETDQTLEGVSPSWHEVGLAEAR